MASFSALTAVVQELEAKVGRGADQVITGRLDDAWEYLREQRELINEVQEATLAVDARLKALENPPLRRRGRPKGSKNKPKDIPVVEVPPAPFEPLDPNGGDSSNPKASDT